MEKIITIELIGWLVNINELKILYKNKGIECMYFLFPTLWYAILIKNRNLEASM